MKTVIEMAQEAGFTCGETAFMQDNFLLFAELVRADERNSWPAEMEAMERQVNILTDALNDRQRWFDALEAQHKQAVKAEREACANVCDEAHELMNSSFQGAAAAIRARGSNT